MIYAGPGATFTAILEGATTGLTGTLGVRIENADGTNHTARTTAGIAELEASSGAYAKANLVAPTTAGEYVVMWDTGGGSPSFANEELIVTSTAPVSSVPSGSDLTTLAAVRAYLQKETGDTAQDTIIQSLVTRASKAIMRYTEREFAPVTASATRTFAYVGNGHLDLAPYDLRSTTSLTIDSEGSSPSTLAANTDYWLRPNPSQDGTYTYLELPGQSTSYWGASIRSRQVSITGAWGFASIPEDVAHWCIVTVALWLRRDVAAFESTFSLDEDRLERPSALPSAVRAGLSYYKRVSV